MIDDRLSHSFLTRASAPPLSGENMALEQNEVELEAKSPRRGGCLFLSIFLFLVWAAGAWLLWHAAKDAPKSPRDEASESRGNAPFFEIIPGSDERSSPDDDMEDRGRIQAGSGD